MNTSKQTMTKISVVVPSFNRASYLDGALNSLTLQQTNGRFEYEVLIVDNAYLDSADPFPFDDWIEKGSSSVAPDTWRALTRDECHKMLRSGIIELGSHTHTHEDFRNRPDAFRDSLRASIRFLHQEFGITAPSLSLPYGIIKKGFAGSQYSATAESEGAACCLTTEEELVVPRTSPISWGRFIAEQHDTASTLAVKLDGWRDAARNHWRRLRGQIASDEFREQR